ncbi:putative secretion accessory protein EsaA/YueB [Streptococcus sp. DD11]|uniref:type VII secretion protein EsaA n=1 Tax=Streptococcus sp. DD11 TaxID=1777879 RepID=UPI000794674B|nr:type VII secretion protein EsaA [Streptococcus sp. DD11]KXT85017.1 putative secretion accessory protein EsaA/YueB [Streptococcus sp. DD11]
MGNKKVIKYIGNIVLIIALLAAVVALNISVQKNTTSSNNSKLKTSQQTKLNVAIVNEDQAVRVDKKEYNLGASYVKNIERDDSQNWFVVTRGAADSGLSNGKYQLAITIPSDFSEKILDVNAISADKTTVTYKVNAAGNLQVENDANNLAKDIIADLNSQLVDMYMASILSNLYTAQQNVQASSEVQIANIGSYRTNLLESAIGSKNIFPTLVSMSSSSVEANNSLKTTLETYSKAFDDLDQSQSAYGNNFENLIKQRGEDQISYAAFMDQLIGTDGLHQLIESQYSALQENQANLTSQLGETAQANNDDADNLAKQVSDLEAALQAERAKLDGHKQVISEFVAQKLETYYGVNRGNSLTLGQVLNTAASDKLTNAENALKNQLAAAVAELPADDFSGQTFSAFNLSVSVPSVDYSAARQFGTPGGGPSSGELAELVNQATATSGTAGQAGTSGSVSWTAPSGVTVNSVSYAGTALTDGQKINLVENGTFEVQYSVTNDAAANSTNASISIMLNGVQATSVNADLPAVRQAAALYGQKTQQIASAYTRVQGLLDAYYSLQELKNGDMTEALTNLLVDAIQSNLDSYQNSLSQGDNGQPDQGVQQNLNVSIDQLKTKIEGVRTSNQDLAAMISAQIKKYGEMKEAIAVSQDSSSKAFAKTDSDLTSLGSEFTSLLASTSGVKASSQTNVEAADSVNQIFSSLNRELENAQGTTEKLSTDAEGLMGQFNKELEDNGNFVESFVKVLNNAYENGVPNEVLLDFLSSPVAQSSSSVKATVNVYRPFTWILLLEIVSLFTAYLFATQNIVRRVKDRFKLNKLQDTDITTVGILGFLSLTIGLIIGIVSSVQLYVGKEYVPSWVLLIVVASFVLIQGQYLILKHFRVLGMGLAFFMIVSFVYLSNAIGTTASLTGFPAFIKNLNALSVLEGMLSGYFDGKTAGFFAVFGLIVVLALLVAANIFIKTKTLKTEEV